MNKKLLIGFLTTIFAIPAFAVVKCKQPNGKVVYSQTGSECEGMATHLDTRPTSGGIGFRSVEEADAALRETETQIEADRAKRRLNDALQNQAASQDKLMFKKDRRNQQAQIDQLKEQAERASNNAQQARAERLNAKMERDQK